MDVGLWTPDQKSVTKEKVPSRITAAAWSADGKMLGLGMLSGMISVRNQKLEELVKFERRAPIWCMTFLPDVSIPKATNVGGKGTTTIPPPENTDLLAIGCWDKTYSLYRYQYTIWLYTFMNVRVPIDHVASFTSSISCFILLYIFVLEFNKGLLNSKLNDRLSTIHAVCYMQAIH